MKITHIANMSMGGIARLVTDLANEQAIAGHQVQIVSPLYRENVFQQQLHPTVKYAKTPVKSGFSLNLIVFMRQARQFGKADIVHLHAFSPFLIFFTWLTNARIVYTEHGTFQRKHQSNSLKNILKKRILGRFILRRFTHALAFNSEWMKTDSCLKHRCKKVIYNGIPLDEISTPRAKAESKNLLAVGRLEPKKRVNRLINLMKNLQETELKLHILGSGTQKDILKNQVESLQLSKTVVMHGMVDDPMPFYQQSTIFLLGSCNEPFGLVILEAIKYGCIPLIFADAGGALEILEPVCPSLICKNEDEMRQQIVYWLEHPTERIATVQKLQQSIQHKFSARQMAAAYEQLYLQILTRLKKKSR